MRFNGSVTYEWLGESMHVVTSADVSVALRAEWVAVGRLGRGTALVPWESIRALSGWSTPPVVERRLMKPMVSKEKLCDSAHVEADPSANSHQPFRHSDRDHVFSSTCGHGGQENDNGNV